MAKTIPAEKIPDLDKSEDSANGNWSDWSPSHLERSFFCSWTSAKWMSGVQDHVQSGRRVLNMFDW